MEKSHNSKQITQLSAKMTAHGEEKVATVQKI
jgi:hypothetical protein